MPDPTIISSYDSGLHSANLDETISRLDRQTQWKDLSTVIITPASGSIPTRVVASWLAMMTPPNNRVCRLMAIGMEVGAAYSSCIESILNHPELSTWKYVLTIEHDNMPASDSMVRLLETAEAHPEFSAISGLYFTKMWSGVAQCWGDPNDLPLNFRPQKPDPNGGLKEVCGTGMGFGLFRLSMFKDERLRRPWFKTTASTTEGMYSQDLYFWTDARKHGHRCAVDCSIKIGHLDPVNDIVW
jgi:hypothetical protein